MFEINARLKADTIFIKELELSTLLLMNDRRYLWFILVPRIENAVEWCDLDAAAQLKLHEETMILSRLARQLGQADKINIGSLGNVVSQLHVHIIARKINDAAWPAPVWGNGIAQKYENCDVIIAQVLERL